ncbi:MAG: SDR family oxidoreductase, partial [Ignavibacteriaceae bacterium]|nr:SDR family oxidoreductase [Ignavibacteriaceae bacterium]
IYPFCMKLNFESKTVLITGGTRGIGRAIADVFRNSGANLILTGTNPKTIEELNQKFGGEKLKYLNLDFSNEENISDFFSSMNNIDKIDVLINNAGINIIGEFIETDNPDFDKLVNINLKGPYQLSKYIVKKMIANNYGRIINICSIWSKITRSKRSLYTMTKNGLHGLTQTMAIELAPHNILVNSLSPGFTLTDLTKETNTEDELKSISDMIPIRRLAEPYEIANVALFLASEQNSYLTGQNIVVDGGFINV